MKLPTKTETVIDHAKAGAIVRLRRVGCNLSGRQLAKLTGIDAMTMNKLERGLTRWDQPRFDQVLAQIDSLKAENEKGC